MGKVTVEELDVLVTEIFEKKKEIEEYSIGGKKLNGDLVALKEKAVVFLKELDRRDYKAERGTISIKSRWRVNMPSNVEEKNKLWAHLRERDLFDKYATIQSQSLNSLFMQDWEEAKRKGEGIEFKMPGIGEPTLFEDLGMRKR